MSTKTVLEKKQELGLDSTDPFYFDVGCETATSYLILEHGTKNQQSHCLACPFPQCIYILTIMQKRYISASLKLQVLYSLHDIGIPIMAICDKLDINFRFAQQCLKNRIDIQQLLNTWYEIIEKRIAFDNNNIIESQCYINLQLEMI